MDKADPDSSNAESEQAPQSRSPAISMEGPPGAAFEDEDFDSTEDKKGLKRLIANIAPYEAGDLRNVMRQQFIMSLEVERLFSANPDDEDRREAVNTALETALSEEILVAIIVVLVLHVLSSE